VLDHISQALGIEPEEADEFGWIAEVAIKAELPPGWTSRTDEAAGAIHYVNNDTLSSTLENPLTPYLRQILAIGRGYLDNPSDNFFHDQKASLWHMHRDELDFWYGPIQDGEGNNYYLNSKEGISSWQDPRPSKAYIFDLQCVLLGHLQTMLAADDNGLFEGGTPWENEDGAQILTLDGGPVGRRKPSKSSIEKSLKKIRHGQYSDHTFALQQLQRMNNIADWMHDIVQSEEQAQRNRMTQRVEERRMRSKSRMSSKASIRSKHELVDEPPLQQAASDNVHEINIPRIESTVFVEPLH
jgi:hypothetical protein